jgi:hypothetical protein
MPGMRVLLDGQLVPIDRPSLALALATAARRAEAAGRVIVTATADGETIPDETLKAPKDEFCAIAELVLTSASPTRVVGEMLVHAADAIESVRGTQQHAGHTIQRGEPEQAREHLESVFGIWQAVAGGVQQAAEMLSLDLATLRVPDGYGDTIAVSPQIEILVEKLRDLQAAMQRQDWAAMSDLLLFDLDELAKSWGQMLRGLAAVVQEAGPRP